MHPFKLLLFVVFTFTSSAVFSAKTELALKGAKAIQVSTQPKLLINSKTHELNILIERMTALNIPAVSIAFMKNHKISWTLTEGVIDLMSQREIDKNTLFQTAIISKSIFASALLKYRQKQGLDLESDINKLLKIGPLPRHKGSISGLVPFSRLLSHSAATTVYGFRGYDAGGRVISIIDVLKGAGSANSKPILVDNESSTTPSDLLKLASKIHRSYQGLGKSPIINKTVLEMLAQQIESMGMVYFLEKQDDIVTSFSQGRVIDGFRSSLIIHPQTGDGIAIMINSDNGGELINDLLSCVSEVYGWNEFCQVDKNEIVLKSELRKSIKGESEVRKPLQSTLVLVAEGEQF
jgi:hypothetical protein